MLNIKITNRKSERECDLNFRTILAANQERGCEKTPTNRKRRAWMWPLGKSGCAAVIDLFSFRRAKIYLHLNIFCKYIWCKTCCLCQENSTPSSMLPPSTLFSRICLVVLLPNKPIWKKARSGRLLLYFFWPPSRYAVDKNAYDWSIFTPISIPMNDSDVYSPPQEIVSTCKRMDNKIY